MRPRSLSSVAAAVGGSLLGSDGAVRGVAVDSRDVRAGDLFVALVGERADGHDFVEQAFAAGATGALVSRPGAFGGPVVVVEDGARALLDLAGDERGVMDAAIIGITGSTGKTSVKDLAAAVLATRYRVAASPRSFNTEIGLPVTLLAAPADAEVVVCEMGSRGPGHIARLARLARPSVGVVTNVGVAHMETFGTREAVADAKAELVETLDADGTAVLNVDDPIVRGFDARTSARVLGFGADPAADVRVEDMALDAQGRPAFTLRTPSGTERVELAVPGEHMAWNAAAAAACGVALGLSAGECAAGLKEARVSPMRMEVFDAPGGLRVVNDAYNANPASVAAAVKAARVMAGTGRLVAVMGEMAELGRISAEEHDRLGELLTRVGVDELITVGEPASRIAVAAVREGIEPERVEACGTLEEALGVLRKRARPGDVVLVKASRAVGLERLAEALREEGA